MSIDNAPFNMSISPWKNFINPSMKPPPFDALSDEASLLDEVAGLEADATLLDAGVADALPAKTPELADKLVGNGALERCEEVPAVFVPEAWKVVVRPWM